MNLLLKSMINYALIVLIFSLSETIALHANSIKFQNANELFDSKNYTEAIQNYNDLSTNGVSVNLLFNLGNSYYKAGEVGKALSSYQKALKLAPRNPDLIKNFNFVQKQVPTPPIPITVSISKPSSSNLSTIFFEPKQIAFTNALKMCGALVPIDRLVMAAFTS